MKKCILLVCILGFSAIKAQVDPNLLLVLNGGTTAEINNIVGAPSGALIFNTEEGKMYLNTGSGFFRIPSIDTNSIDFWGATGTSGTDAAVNFLGTIDAQDMIIRANNQECIRFSATNQTVLINSANQFNNHPFIIRANGDDLLAFQTNTGVTEWHWNLVGNGLNFVETGIADFRLFLEQGGNVGVNTDTPLAQLDVNGDLRVRNIATTTTDLDVLVTTATGVIQKRPFSDFSGSGIPKLNFGGRWTNTNTTTNLNVNNNVAPIFGNEDYKDDGNTLYEVIGNTLVVKETGRYEIKANLSMAGIDEQGSIEQRTNVNARIAVNGTLIGALAASGYIRFQNNNSFNSNSSIHINEILQLNANDVISIITFQNGNTGRVFFSNANESSISINKLR